MFRIFLLLLSSLCLIAKDKPKPKMALADQLVAYWNMAQNPALFKVWDQSGNGNHLTGSDGAVLATGIINEGIQLNGTATLKLASNTGVSHQQKSFTVGFWFKPLILDESIVILGHPDGQWVVQMELSGSTFYLRIRIAPDDFDATVNVTAVPMVVGQWYFVALGWYDDNGSFAWATVNLSERIRVGAVALPATVTTSPVFWNPHVFDEAAIWRRNVSAEELRQIYNKGKGLAFEEWGAVTPCKTIDCCD